jgi:hypothetical protein
MEISKLFRFTYTFVAIIIRETKIKMWYILLVQPSKWQKSAFLGLYGSLLEHYSIKSCEVEGTDEPSGIQILPWPNRVLYIYQEE